MSSNRALACDQTHLAERFGTPLIVIDEQRLRRTVQRFREAFSNSRWHCDVIYAAKALMLKSIAKLMHDEGLGLDVCSEGELQTAILAGVPPKRCTLHGCAKTAAELELAVRSHVGYVVIDNQAELASLNRVAQTLATRCSVLIRVNVGVGAQTKPQVQTGALQSKFGFPVADGQAIAAVNAVRLSSSLDFAGIHCHIGSQIVDLDSFAQEIDQLAQFASRIWRDLGINCRIINIGGGLGISDSEDELGAPSSETWAQTIFAHLQRGFGNSQSPRPELVIEPGRAIIARSGTTLYTIAVRKTLGNGEEALIVDGGMSDNPRPALYEASYPVSLASRSHAPADGRYTIFGRHCETDLLFRDVPLANPQAGDILAVHNTGAYTYSMASNYNRFARPAVVLVNGNRARLIARREPLEHVLGLDVSDDSSVVVN